jgi:succinate dehydrogenase/fumarate reductase cytochrome b subunit (b558 family)
LFVGGEEQGLLGSAYYAAHPTIPIDKIVANLNIDGGNIFGRTSDVAIIGKGKSDLELRLVAAAQSQRRTVVDEPEPDKGYYYRSDQLNFARAGVPALYFKSGQTYIGRPDGWGREKEAEYRKTRYHQPSDVVTPEWDFSGMVEDDVLAYRIGWDVTRGGPPPPGFPVTSSRPSGRLPRVEAAALSCRAMTDSVAVSRPDTFVGSTIGRKVVMAATGLVLCGFVLGHMVGNLLVFLPDHEAVNQYGRFLRGMLHGFGIWAVRGVLLASVVLHIGAAWSLTRTSWKARPIPYKVVTPDASTYASRTMRWSGPILALFIVYHLLHFTVGTVHPAFVDGDVYRNVIVGFSVWPVSLAYVIADAGPGAAPAPRRVEHVADGRGVAPALERRAQRGGNRLHAGRGPGLHFRSAGGPGRRVEVDPMELRANIPDGPVETKWTSTVSR